MALARERLEKTNAFALISALREQPDSAVATTPKSTFAQSSSSTDEPDNADANALALALAESTKLREKHATACKRLDETKAMLTCARAENARWQKIVSLETGEDASTVNRLATSDTWRGRSQQIALLRAKLKTANDQISALVAVNGGDPHDSNATRAELKRELEELRVSSAISISESESRAAETVSRCASLDSRLREMQRKLQAVVQKANNDDKYIRALHGELANLRTAFSRAPGQQEYSSGSAPLSPSLPGITHTSNADVSCASSTSGGPRPGSSSASLGSQIGQRHSFLPPEESAPTLSPRILMSHVANGPAAASANSHIIPASERESYEAEIRSLSERLDVYLDEVEASKLTIRNAVDFIAGPDVSCYAKVIDVQSFSNQRSALNNHRG